MLLGGISWVSFNVTLSPVVETKALCYYLDRNAKGVGQEYVPSYKLNYSRDGVRWTAWKNFRGDQVCHAFFTFVIHYMCKMNIFKALSIYIFDLTGIRRKQRREEY